MKAGDKVTVEASVVVFNHPQHRGEAFDLKGQTGDVVTVLDDWKGRPISPTLPVIVAFGRYKAHFRDDELTLAS
ncbi:MAG: ferredoxin-thioredoxin reductase variable chain [Synechococcus sp.]